LPEPLRAQEAGHDAGFDREGKVVDRALIAVVLGEVLGFNHAGKQTIGTLTIV